jgi:hypothetical protein
MSREISTDYIKGGFAESGEVVLSESATTRLVFKPAVHGAGVRGKLIRQKIGADKSWVSTNDVNFLQVPPDGGIQLELDTAATTKLFQHLEDLYKVQAQGVELGHQQYVVAKKGDVVLVDDEAKANAIRELVEQGHSAEVWQELVAQDPDLATRLAVGQLQMERRTAVLAFEQALDSHPDDEAFWQGFFKRQPWMLHAAFSSAVVLLGDDIYVGGKAPVGRQGKGGVATDFLFADQSTTSFAVVEIKVPKTQLVGGLYRGKAGAGDDQETYSMSADLSGGVVQTRNQIAVAVDYFESVLARGDFGDLNRVHPKGVLIAGRTDGLGARKKSSFDHFRQGLFSLTVITFDELLNRLAILHDVEIGA